jgi:hypothetical protein
MEIRSHGFRAWCRIEAWAFVELVAAPGRRTTRCPDALVQR